MVAVTHRDVAGEPRGAIEPRGAGEQRGAGARRAVRAWTPPNCDGASAKCRNVARCEWPRQRLALLTRTIEQEIVPRLVLARRSGAGPHAAPPPGAAPVHPGEAAELARLAIGRDGAAAGAFVQQLRDRGVPLEALYLDLLAPAARRLGEMWSADLCDFTQVTMGVWHLQQALRETDNDLPGTLLRREDDRRILLVPVPGEQHTFGVAMVAAFFRQAGWSVWSEPLASSNDLVGIVRSEWFAVVGFSLSSSSRLQALATNIRRVRRASRNPAVGVLVGGPVFVAQPELAVMVGADATAANGLQAALQAESLLALRATSD